MSVRDKILVANRGEIARRVLRSCRRLGLATVAVYSEPDASAAHVADADESICLGPPQSYLMAERILAAAERTGATAIHPGYGFLSENASFARAVVAKGLIWIGPEPEVIEIMGDKQRARDAAKDAGLPVVPGSKRFGSADLSGLEAAGRQVGFPLLAKAAGGGGGIGMRRVDDPEKLPAIVATTQAMAHKAFGQDSVYLERLIETARHVEVQVFGFGDGHAVHFYERDCSVQRRFQKVIEETPAPELSDKISGRMCELAIALARATKYSGAGTVEFILDTRTNEFYFLEMNTRIQVEHPVTEMVTKTDLIALQIELARRRLIPFSQATIHRAGAAIEARIYAENPAKMFMPSPGPLRTFRLPQETSDLRVDSGYQEGAVVTHYYDPLLAKVIGHGRTREEARRRTRDALLACQIEGIATNLSFLVACLENEAFIAGDVDTRFIDEHHRSLTTPLATARRGLD